MANAAINPYRPLLSLLQCTVKLQAWHYRNVNDYCSQLLSQPAWEVRHGALLGLRYTLAVRADLVDTLLPRVLGDVTRGLQVRLHYCVKHVSDTSYFIPKMV